MSTAAAFVPADLDATRFENVEPLYRALIDRPIAGRQDLERWILDRSELDAAISEAQALLYINMTCDTSDTAASAAYLKLIEEVVPKIKPLNFALDRKLASLADSAGLDANRYGVLVRDTQAEVRLFREENVAIETRLSQLEQEYESISGAMTVQFDGREQTLPQMARYQESTDRAVRESAYRAVSERRLKDAERIDAIYERLVLLRHMVAKNAGFENYIGHAFMSKRRFDYTPAHCAAFHDAVERVVVPFIRSMDARRAKLLGVDALRPWDLGVDVKGRPPLRPFEGGADLVRKSVATFQCLDPKLAAILSGLGDGANTRGSRGGASMDLDSRKGKAPGGYQYMRDRMRKPFIFMNAAGLQRDVITMLHEAGHAFHSELCRDEPLLHYRHSPTEFAEVASMSMELLTMPYWGAGKGGFYTDEESLGRARRQQLEKSISVLAWIATIDAFQHWVYANPTHSPEQRREHWLSLDARFGNAVSWDGLESARANLWHRQLHLFTHAFYYIEYGIAQLGSIQLWLKSRQDNHQALANYRAALKLGGTRTLPELFSTAGLVFDFSNKTIEPLMKQVGQELASLDA